VAELLGKLALYFRPLESYWTATDPEQRLAAASGPLGRYPLDLIPRLDQGHYDRFDDRGLPIRRARDGAGFYHNYTTVFSFALAHWDKYLLSGEESHADVLLEAARFLLRSAERLDDGSVLLHQRAGGALSSMVQGEAISVLARAWLRTGSREYLDAARGCVLPFRRGLDDHGVVATLAACGVPWYEEFARRPLVHVLNGMIYALWGLRDLILVAGERAADDGTMGDAPAGDAAAGELFDQGVESVERALPLFDAGYWSYNAVCDEGPPYVASMMYHNLHVVQLAVLAQQTGREPFAEYSRRFARYGNRVSCRLRAALLLPWHKLALRRRKQHDGSNHDVTG